MNTECKVGAIKFDTPLLLGSGYITEKPDFFLRAKRHGCAAMITRSLKKKVPVERAVIPAPRYAVRGTTMLNCEWGNENPWTSWRDGWVDQVSASGSPLIVSLSGRDIEGCANLVSVFSEMAVSAFEVNISCSHSGALHGNLNVDFEHIQELMVRIRPLTKKPIWIKLSYSPFVVTMAEVAAENGADAIVCTNSVGPGLFIDVESQLPVLGIQGGAGGVTGKAIFPIALRCVYEISQAVSIPVVGVGGIWSSDDVLQMMMAGASAVQLYTKPALEGPIIYKHIMQGLNQYLLDHSEIKSLQELVGIAHRKRSVHQFKAPAPQVIAENCIGCAVCAPSCAFNAIDFQKRPDGPALAVINKNCIGCNACVGVCPPELEAIKAVYEVT
jgi:dihydroorotate dehydrogenase subfamily 1